MATPSPDVLLADPYWGALITGQASVALGGALARRFPSQTIPFAGLAENTPEALDALCDLLAAGESVYVASHAPLVHPQLTQLLQMSGIQMLYPTDAALPDAPADIRVELLHEDAVPEMIELKAIAFPGYFGPSAARLGAFYGIRSKDGALVAMCGERLMLPGFRELSALCTHPAHIGKGYAGALLIRLLHKHRAESIVSFLHVVADNSRAINLYRRLGFIQSRALTWRTLQRV